MVTQLDGIDAQRMTYDLNYKFSIMGDKSKRSKNKEKKYPKNIDKYLYDITLEIDLKVKKIEEVNGKTLQEKIKSFFSNKLIREEFEILLVSEVILRALKRIKFKNIGLLVINENEAYNKPDNWNDTEEVLKVLQKYQYLRKNFVDLLNSIWLLQ